MKKLLMIALTVLGYLLIEGFLVSRVYNFLPKTLLFVTTAGMLAAFIWGGRPSAKRALGIVGAVITSPLWVGIAAIIMFPVMFGMMLIAILLPVSLQWVNIYCLVGALWTPLFVSLVSRKFRYRSLQSEADQWLSDRQRYGAVGLRRRSRLNRWSLWLPTIVVLAFLFFWTPLQGRTGRPFSLEIGNLPNHRIKIPLRWRPIWIYEQRDESVTLLKLPSIGLPALMLTQDWMSVSEIRIKSLPAEPNAGAQHLMEQTRQYANNLNSRQVPASIGKLTCWEYTGKYSPPDSNFLWARCSNDDGSFVAAYEGNRLELESFYSMVANVKFQRD